MLFVKLRRKPRIFTSSMFDGMYFSAIYSICTTGDQVKMPAIAAVDRVANVPQKSALKARRTTV